MRKWQRARDKENEQEKRRKFFEKDSKSNEREMQGREARRECCRFRKRPFLASLQF